jgi:hypothetical protein
MESIETEHAAMTPESSIVGAHLKTRQYTIQKQTFLTMARMLHPILAARGRRETLWMHCFQVIEVKQTRTHNGI